MACTPSSAQAPDAKTTHLDDQLDAPESLASQQEAQWRAGVNRQAQPDATAHQLAASQAAAAKRTANAMTAEERKARRAQAEARRREAKKQAQLEQPLPAIEESSASDDETDCDEGAAHLDELNAMLKAVGAPAIDQLEFDKFSAWAEDCGLALDEDAHADWRCTHDYDCFKLDRDVDDWVAEGMPESDGKEDYCLPWQELKDRLDEGLEPLDNEPQFVWDARVAAARAERGIPLGDYLMYDAITVAEFLMGQRAPWRDLMPTEREREWGLRRA